MVEAILKADVIWGDVPKINGISELDFRGSGLRQAVVEKVDAEENSSRVNYLFFKSVKIYLPERNLGLRVDYLA